MFGIDEGALTGYIISLIWLCFFGLALLLTVTCAIMLIRRKTDRVLIIVTALIWILVGASYVANTFIRNEHRDPNLSIDLRQERSDKVLSRGDRNQYHPEFIEYPNVRQLKLRLPDGRRFDGAVRGLMFYAPKHRIKNVQWHWKFESNTKARARLVMWSKKLDTPIDTLDLETAPKESMGTRRVLRKTKGMEIVFSYYTVSNPENRPDTSTRANVKIKFK